MYLSQAVAQGYGETKAIASTAVTVTEAATSTGLLTAAGVAAAIPIVGGVIAGVAALLTLFHVGEGCGNACIQSAETEQIFEAAADNVNYAAQAGMLNRAQAIAAIQWLQQQGDQVMASLASSDSKANSGKTNMDKTLQNEISGIQSTSSISDSGPTVAIDSTKLQGSIFIQPGTSGWYASSVSQGASLALQAIAQVSGIADGSYVVPGSSTSIGTTTSASGIVSELESELLSTNGLLIIGGLAALFLLTRGKS